MADDEMTIPEAADLLGLDRSSLFRAVQRGRIPARRVGKHVLLVRRDDVEAYRHTRRNGPPSGPCLPAATDAGA